MRWLGDERLREPQPGVEWERERAEREARYGENETEQFLCIAEYLGTPPVELIGQANRRRAFFEEVLMSRRRDNVDWSVAKVKQVFAHRDAQHLTRVRELVLQVRAAIMKNFPSVLKAFKACRPSVRPPRGRAACPPVPVDLRRRTGFCGAVDQW